MATKSRSALVDRAKAIVAGGFFVVFTARSSILVWDW